jgi:hypothetical protein
VELCDSLGDVFHAEMRGDFINIVSSRH